MKTSVLVQIRTLQACSCARSYFVIVITTCLTRFAFTIAEPRRLQMPVHSCNSMTVVGIGSYIVIFTLLELH